jgi:(1->4)-alpha-D-glucan 1-alpha-D-glucosylmutase
VDFALRRRLLAELKARLDSGETRTGVVADLLGSRGDGRIKLYMLWQGLNFRNRHEGMFIGGDYLPLDCAGEKAENIVAFLRRDGKDLALVAAARFFTRLVRSGLWPPSGETVWKDTVVLLPEGVCADALTDVFTGRRVALVRKDGRAAVRATDMFDPLAATILTNAPGPAAA